MKAKILHINPAPYGQYDTELVVLVEDGGLSESVLRRCDLPADIAVGQTREVTLYRGLVETVS